MKIVLMKHIPLAKGFYAINLFGIVFSRGHLNAEEQRHEYIHTLQQREMLFVFFYLWYITEWLIRLIIYRNALKAYRNISFEREAYGNAHVKDYPKQRRLFAWACFLC